MKIDDIEAGVRDAVRRGMVIPAMPLALDANRKFDERRQRVLTRYYIDAGAGGIAVGVHSTQFEIRDPAVGLFRPVLQVVSEAADEWCGRRGRMVLKVAGVCGSTTQAVGEARTALELGYHASMVSLAALKDATVPELVSHCREMAAIMPIIGFYLQTAVGGRVLPRAFWREFARIDNVLAIKMAPFNRYQTLDVVRGICEAGRENEIALYTGNDDNIVVDLLTPFRVETERGAVTARIVGGLLGHWAFWTRRAVELVDKIRAIRESGAVIPPKLLTRAAQITDANGAIFDAANGFAGCIPGVHEVLRRQGLFAGTWCLNPNERMSPGQAEEIDRVYREYPYMNDDEWVRERLEMWNEE
ncbi:MAG TPA: dihydrodipicolinate synthase family protein [Planctomycetota bacterium]|nr:dihydrodipicolinate synthase family protein [Planctomycetota bacterium]